jgi:hypothetical protein
MWQEIGVTSCEETRDVGVVKSSIVAQDSLFSPRACKAKARWSLLLIQLLSGHLPHYLYEKTVETIRFFLRN